MGRRAFFVVSGWLAAAALATVIGVGAIRLVGESIASTPGGVRSQADVARELAAASPTTAAPAPTRSAAAAPTAPAGNRKTFDTPGGSVIAQCVGSRVELVLATPAQGYQLTNYERGEAEVHFEGPGGHFEVKLACPGGVPVSND